MDDTESTPGAVAYERNGDEIRRKKTPAYSNLAMPIAQCGACSTSPRGSAAPQPVKTASRIRGDVIPVNRSKNE